ncbi:MAG: D-2-hydroxyacid dehydrogenase [Novosphingobium sp.]|nr:D-2-hydroxyacid dehydrogenase [Novosphingobium sp.]
MTVAAISQHARRFVEGRLPDWVEPRWFSDKDELYRLLPEVEIGWFDGAGFGAMLDAPLHAQRLRWLNTFTAGVEAWPLEDLRKRGVIFTNGTGVNDIAVAEYVILGMLVLAKQYHEVVRAQDHSEWLPDAPGKIELNGTRALIVGAGAIGTRVAALLAPFEVHVTEVRRGAREGAIGADEWRDRLGEFDWVIVLVPATADTNGMFGEVEFAAMKQGASILNFARGSVLDQPALIAAVNLGHLGGAFLDVTDPEPLPSDHPLWKCENIRISQHLSGRSQTALFARASQRFLENLSRWEKGEALLGTVDLDLGY